MTKITPTSTCALLLFFSVPTAVSLSFSYSTFSPEDQKDIRVEGDAYIGAGWIDITSSRIMEIKNSYGRASYNAPVPLWDSHTGEVASFITRFSFKISRLYKRGLGMAFFLAHYPSILQDVGQGGGSGFGLTNQNGDVVASGDSRFVAVEFNTFNGVNDTADDIGINVNSIKSKKTLFLPSFTLNSSGDMTATIEYNNVSSILAVTLWLNNGRGPNYSLGYEVELKRELPEQVAVGFSAATGLSSSQTHKLLSWHFNSTLDSKGPAGQKGGGGLKAGAIAGAATLFFVILLAMAALLVRRRNEKKKREADDNDIGSEDDDGEPLMEIEMGTGVTGPRRFPYHELVNATRNFAAEEKLGQGGFGAVYRGYLREHGLAVAIKRFSKDSSSMQGRKEYTSEIKAISRLRHRNLVQLVGWCHGREGLLLVYELMPNRSLDIHLHGNGTFLTWPMRLNIMVGLGSALLYLHEELEQCVVHRDIKPSNVMLDESFGAKLGDFGLARFIHHAVGMQTMTDVLGTPGYVDPQYLITGKASAESDVYSFGVVLLEVACGRRPLSLLDRQISHLVEWVWDLYGQGAIHEVADRRLGGDYDETEMKCVMAIGLWCAHPDPSVRPPIRAAMEMLRSKETGPALPARRPVPTMYEPRRLSGLNSYGSWSTEVSVLNDGR